MKQEILNKLTPVVDKFVEGLLKIYFEAEEKRKDVENEILSYKKMQEELKTEKAENNKAFQNAMDRLAEERLRQVEKNNEVTNEIARYSKLNKELESKIFEVDQKLKSINVEKELISQYLEKAKNKEGILNDKLIALKRDEEVSETRKKELEEKEKSLVLKDKTLQKNIDENIIKANELNEMDLSIKGREKEIQRLIKRYELERFIKEK